MCQGVNLRLWTSRSILRSWRVKGRKPAHFSADMLADMDTDLKTSLTSRWALSSKFLRCLGRKELEHYTKCSWQSCLWRFSLPLWIQPGEKVQSGESVLWQWGDEDKESWQLPQKVASGDLVVSPGRFFRPRQYLCGGSTQPQDGAGVCGG